MRVVGLVWRRLMMVHLHGQPVVQAGGAGRHGGTSCDLQGSSGGDGGTGGQRVRRASHVTTGAPKGLAPTPAPPHPGGATRCAPLWQGRRGRGPRSERVVVYAGAPFIGGGGLPRSAVDKRHFVAHLSDGGRNAHALRPVRMRGELPAFGEARPMGKQLMHFSRGGLRFFNGRFLNWDVVGWWIF